MLTFFNLAILSFGLGFLIALIIFGFWHIKHLTKEDLEMIKINIMIYIGLVLICSICIMGLVGFYIMITDLITFIKNDKDPADDLLFIGSFFLIVLIDFIWDYRRSRSTK